MLLGVCSFPSLGRFMPAIFSAAIYMFGVGGLPTPDGTGTQQSTADSPELLFLCGVAACCLA